MDRKFFAVCDENFLKRDLLLIEKRFSVVEIQERGIQEAQEKEHVRLHAWTFEKSESNLRVIEVLLCEPGVNPWWFSCDDLSDNDAGLCKKPAGARST